MKIADQKIEDRPEQHYVAIRSQVAMDELPTVIPRGGLAGCQRATGQWPHYR